MGVLAEPGLVQAVRVDRHRVGEVGYHGGEAWEEAALGGHRHAKLVDADDVLGWDAHRGEVRFVLRLDELDDRPHLRPVVVHRDRAEDGHCVTRVRVRRVLIRENEAARRAVDVGAHQVVG